jgi:branched-chain amino acid transport system permease protein
MSLKDPTEAESIGSGDDRSGAGSGGDGGTGSGGSGGDGGNGGSSGNGGGGRGSGSTGNRLQSFFDRDIVLILAVIGGIYLTYLLTGLALGFEARGLINVIARLTFLIGVFSMLALALNLHWGYTGLFNIGVVGFMAVGIYTMAMVSKPASTGGAAQIPGLGLPIWVGVIAGVLAAALLGLLVALPALRLRADYLAIVTIAMSEIVRFVYMSGQFQEFSLLGAKLGTGGGSGLILNYTDPLAALFEFFGLSGLYDGLVGTVSTVVPNNPEPVVNQFVYAALLMGFVAGFYWLLKRTGESPFGRVLKAIREDEDATGSLGKDTNAFKIKSFMLGCALMGLGGILWYMGQGAVTPLSFRPQVTFFVWIALIIGGAGSNTGSVIGGAVFAAVLFEGPIYFRNLLISVFPIGDAPDTFGQALAPLLSAFEVVPLLAFTLDNMSTLRLVIMGVVLVYIMKNRPEGLMGHRTEIASSIDLSRPKASKADSMSAPATAADGGRADE